MLTVDRLSNFQLGPYINIIRKVIHESIPISVSNSLIRKSVLQDLTLNRKDVRKFKTNGSKVTNERAGEKSSRSKAPPQRKFGCPLSCQQLCVYSSHGILLSQHYSHGILELLAVTCLTFIGYWAYLQLVHWFRKMVGNMIFFFNGRAHKQWRLVLPVHTGLSLSLFTFMSFIGLFTLSLSYSYLSGVPFGDGTGLICQRKGNIRN